MNSFNTFWDSPRNMKFMDSNSYDDKLDEFVDTDLKIWNFEPSYEENIRTFDLFEVSNYHKDSSNWSLSHLDMSDLSDIQDKMSSELENINDSFLESWGRPEKSSKKFSMPSSKQLIKPVYHKPAQTPIIEEETKLSNTSMSSFIVSVIRYVESSLYPKKLNSSLYSA